MVDGTHTADIWAHWLLQLRHGGDPEFERFIRCDVERFRQRVLDGAKLVPGMTLVDIGAGDGLIAFGAIAQIGTSLHVILTDISESLLEHARQVAVTLGVQDQCRFVLGSADKLEGLADASVDVVTTRASLAYVPDKMAALREFHRVLKPGGRISLAEPIKQDEAFEVCALGRLIAAQPAHPCIEFLRLLHRWKAAQYPSTEEQVWLNPLTNFSERDLMRFARQAGFIEVHLEMHIDCRLNSACDGSPRPSWEVFLSISPHPWAPPLRQIMAEQFSVEEQHRFEQLMRPQVESPTWNTFEVMTYLSAVKGAGSETSPISCATEIPI